LFLGTKSMNKSSLNANVDQHFCMISERSCETDGVMKIAITGFKYKTVLLFTVYCKSSKYSLSEHTYFKYNKKSY